MRSQVDLAKSASPEHPSYPVEFRSCWWGLIELPEIKLYQLLQLIQVLTIR